MFIDFCRIEVFCAFALCVLMLEFKEMTLNVPLDELKCILCFFLQEKILLDYRSVGENKVQIILKKNLIYNFTDHIFNYTLTAEVSVETLLYSAL